MAFTNSITMTGVDSIQRSLAAMGPRLDKEVIQALGKIGVIVQAGAQERVPVSSASAGRDPDANPGNLRRSIRYRVNPALKEVRIGVDSSDAEYGVFVEFGTNRIAGGKVKSLGLGLVPDGMAVKQWPALESRGGHGQQMPWLRPAAFAAQDEALALFRQAGMEATSKSG